MNLADPELELVDPTPNVHTLFIHFDKEFFWTKLASRAVVRWSKKMYSCAGICSYEGRGGLCDIALSEPLLKLRPRKDLVETLLHEMIHAFLFVTNRDQDRDGHGPNFKSHMHRINSTAGLNISIYHDFHDEVKLYQTHWWRCNGPCQTRRPHFGIVRRPINKAPGTYDYWWKDHLKKCGGTFIKIKEPENFKPRKTGKSSDNTKKTTKPNGDITKYINNTIKTIKDLTNNNSSAKPVLKDSNINKPNIKTKTNSSGTLVSNKGNGVIPSVAKPQTQPIPLFTGNGYTINATKPLPDYKNVTEHVRNIWASKDIPSVINKVTSKPVKSLVTKTASTSNVNKHKANNNDLNSPPAKMKKINDYFNATTVLKDLYGDDFVLKKPSNGTKLVAVTVKQDLVDCPICKAKIDSKEINRHLDECLNKDVIEKLSNNKIVSESKPSHSSIDSKKIVGDVKPIPEFKGKLETTNNNVVDLTNLNNFFDFDTFCDNNVTKDKDRRKTDSLATLQSVNINSLTSLTSERPINKMRKSDNFITKDRGDNTVIKTEKDVVKQNEPTAKFETDIVKMKSEPGTSKDSKASDQVCPCCGKKFDKSVEEHLDECLVFFDNNSTIPEEGASTSFNNSTIVIDDDDNDIFDDSQVFNETGTKFPCPCCMNMVEQAAMNEHLDLCLGH